MRTLKTPMTPQRMGRHKTFTRSKGVPSISFAAATISWSGSSTRTGTQSNLIKRCILVRRSWGSQTWEWAGQWMLSRKATTMQSNLWMPMHTTSGPWSKRKLSQLGGMPTSEISRQCAAVASRPWGAPWSKWITLGSAMTPSIEAQSLIFQLWKAPRTPTSRQWSLWGSPPPQWGSSFHPRPKMPILYLFSGLVEEISRSFRIPRFMKPHI